MDIHSRESRLASTENTSLVNHLEQKTSPNCFAEILNSQIGEDQQLGEYLNNYSGECPKDRMQGIMSKRMQKKFWESITLGKFTSFQILIGQTMKYRSLRRITLSSSLECDAVSKDVIRLFLFGV